NESSHSRVASGSGSWAWLGRLMPMGRGVSCEVTLSFSLREAMDRPWELRFAGGPGSFGLGAGKPTVAVAVRDLHTPSASVARRTRAPRRRAATESRA